MSWGFAAVVSILAAGVVWFLAWRQERLAREHLEEKLWEFFTHAEPAHVVAAKIIEVYRDKPPLVVALYDDLLARYVDGKMVLAEGLPEWYVSEIAMTVLQRP